MATAGKVPLLLQVLVMLDEAAHKSLVLIKPKNVKATKLYVVQHDSFDLLIILWMLLLLWDLR